MFLRSRRLIGKLHASVHVARAHKIEICGSRRPLAQSEPSAAADIAAFVAKARAMSPHTAGDKGRLVFALDATMSRQPTWDMACSLQADMFREAASVGTLDIRLVYYRGLNECRATHWISDSTQLAKLMSKIDCQGGNTQIGRCCLKRGARRLPLACARWCSSAMPWRRRLMSSAPKRANSGC